MGEKTDMNRANEVRPMFRRLADPYVILTAVQERPSATLSMTAARSAVKLRGASHFYAPHHHSNPHS